MSSLKSGTTYGIEFGVSQDTFHERLQFFYEVLSVYVSIPHNRAIHI